MILMFAVVVTGYLVTKHYGIFALPHTFYLSIAFFPIRDPTPPNMFVFYGQIQANGTACIAAGSEISKTFNYTTQTYYNESVWLTPPGVNQQVSEAEQEGLLSVQVPPNETLLCPWMIDNNS